MSHKPQKQQFDSKRERPPEYNDDLLKRIEEAVKPDNQENKEASNGRDKGN